MGVAEDVSSGGLSRIRPTYGYYRQPNGWITAQAFNDLDQLHRSRVGETALTQYGRFDMTTAYAANNPFDALFQRGGAKEMPVEQVIANGFHVHPPLKPVCGMVLTQFYKTHTAACFAGAQPVQFPQLTTIPDVCPCQFCEREFYTEAARNQHERVMHKEDKATTATGEAIAKAIQPQQPVGIDSLVQAAVAEALKDMGMPKQRRKRRKLAAPASPQLQEA